MIATNNAPRLASRAAILSHFFGSSFSNILSVNSHNYSYKIFWHAVASLPKIHRKYSESEIQPQSFFDRFLDSCFCTACKFSILDGNSFLQICSQSSHRDCPLPYRDNPQVAHLAR
jgi:hypothetical protein